MVILVISSLREHLVQEVKKRQWDLTLKLSHPSLGNSVELQNSITHILDRKSCVFWCAAATPPGTQWSRIFIFTIPSVYFTSTKGLALSAQGSLNSNNSGICLSSYHVILYKEIILAEIGPISLIRGPTGSHLLSIMCTTLLPKTNITGDNSNPRRLSTVAIKHETETENTAFLWGINSKNISKGDRLKPWEGNWNISLLNVLTYAGPYEKETWVLSDITHSTWSWDLSHCG